MGVDGREGRPHGVGSGPDMGRVKADAGEDFAEAGPDGKPVYRPWWWALRDLDDSALHAHVREAGWTRVADDSGRPDSAGEGHSRRGHLVFPTGVECMCCKFRWLLRTGTAPNVVGLDANLRP